ncbi:DUF5667 domain-containing protein [Chloroflexota bacterium]
MRKSREFDNVLDECLEQILVRGKTVEQCLQDFPQYVDELKPLLETALATKEASAIQPRPEFRDRARYQFYSVLRVTKPEKSYSIFGWQLRWVTVVATILTLLLAGSGTVAAASTSMPDELLYPVKLATEQVQLALTPSTMGKMKLYTKLADKRVLEIVRMADENKPEQIELTAQRLDTYLSRVTDLASTQVVMAADTMTAPAVKEAPIVEEEPTLKKAAPALKGAPTPPGQAKGNKKAQSQVERRAEVKASVTNDAINNSARLREILETAPESAKPALLRAIAISESGYKKALESLKKP